MRRRTRQRTAVENALGQDTSRFLSAQQIHHTLTSSGDEVGLATVYRQLQSLADNGDVDTLRSDTGELLYRQCAVGAHHHHIVCRHCGRAEDLPVATVERWVESVAESSSFVDVEHTVELFGLCADCAR